PAERVDQGVVDRVVVLDSIWVETEMDAVQIRGAHLVRPRLFRLRDLSVAGALVSNGDVSSSGDLKQLRQSRVGRDDDLAATAVALVRVLLLPLGDGSEVL